MTNSFFYFAFADIRCTKDKAKEFGIWIMLRSTASILQKSNANENSFDKVIETCSMYFLCQTNNGPNLSIV